VKKLVTILALALVATTATAQHYGHRHNHHRHHGHYYGHGGWVAPLIIGGSIGYILNRPAPVVVEQPPVYVQPQPVIQPQCTRYIYQDQNGQTIREEIRCN
jgi:hypothetical protein